MLEEQSSTNMDVITPDAAPYEALQNTCSELMAAEAVQIDITFTLSEQQIVPLSERAFDAARAAKFRVMAPNDDQNSCAISARTTQAEFHYQNKCVSFETCYDVSDCEGAGLPRLSLRAVVDEAVKADIVRYFDKRWSKRDCRKQFGVTHGKIRKESLQGNANQNAFHKSYPEADDYMTNPVVLDDVFQVVGWTPSIDICSSVTGQNATAPLYFDAMRDGRQQLKAIQGQDCICNPPFYQTEDYVRLLNEAFKCNRRTRALLVVPARKTQTWFKELQQDKQWRLVAFYFQGADVFTGANPTAPLKGKRKRLRGAVEDITIWELNQEPAYEPHLSYSQIPVQRNNMIPYFLRDMGVEMRAGRKRDLKALAKL